MCSFRSLIFTRTSSCRHTLLGHSSLASRTPCPRHLCTSQLRSGSCHWDSARGGGGGGRGGGRGAPPPPSRGLRAQRVLSSPGLARPSFPQGDQTPAMTQRASVLVQRLATRSESRVRTTHPQRLRRRTGRPSRHRPSSRPLGFAPLPDPRSQPAAPAPRSVAGPSCTLTGAGSEASSRSQSGPPEETPS